MKAKASKSKPEDVYIPDFGLLIRGGGEEDNNPQPSDYPRAERWNSKVAAGMAPERSAGVYRATAETKVDLILVLDGTGQAEIATGVGFFDHMLTLFAKHGLFDLKIQAQGDLNVDPHHTVEDVGICLGKALAQALGNKEGIRRYGHFTLPMDEALVTTTVDLGGRSYFVWRAEVPREKLGEFDSSLAEDFWQAVANNALMNLHAQCHYGRNTHHIIEGIFKATARALREAVELDPRVQGVPSTKGTLTK